MYCAIQTGQYFLRKLIKRWNVTKSMGLAPVNIFKNINVCCPTLSASVFRKNPRPLVGSAFFSVRNGSSSRTAKAAGSTCSKARLNRRLLSHRLHQTQQLQQAQQPQPQAANLEFGPLGQLGVFLVIAELAVR